MASIETFSCATHERKHEPETGQHLREICNYRPHCQGDAGAAAAATTAAANTAAANTAATTAAAAAGCQW